MESPSPATTTTTPSSVSFSTHARDLDIRCLRPKNLYYTVPTTRRDGPPRLASILSAELVNDIRQALSQAFNEENQEDRFKAEREFSQECFRKLRSCPWNHAESREDLIIVCKQGTMAYGIQWKVKSDSIEALKMHNRTSRMVLDHACVLLEKENGEDSEWITKSCTAVLEMKVESSSCAIVPVDDQPGLYKTPFFDQHFNEQSGAFVQVLKYALDVVWPCLCAMGQGSTRFDEDMPLECGQNIPFTIVAFRKCETKNNNKKPRASAQKRCRWLEGSLLIPDICGDRFQYRVTGHQGFDEKNNVSNAVEAYLDFLYRGLQLAASSLEWYRPQRQETNAVTPRRMPHPLSGRSPVPQDFLADCELVGSTLCSSRDFKVYQGEIWRVRGESTIKKVFERVEFSLSSHNSNSTVLVKINSPTVHHTFVDANDSFPALRDLCRDGQLALKLGRCLLGVSYLKEVKGLLTVMRDMKAEGYIDLKPNDYQGSLCNLWNGFEQLVDDVLIPMASLGIVHADIRAGWDSTANILVKVHAASNYEMVMIDYDSVIAVRRSNLLMDWKDGRYIREKPKMDAISYVWWQCCYMAWTWLNKKSQGDLQKSDRIHEGCVVDVIQDIYQFAKHELRNESSDPAENRLTENDVHELLQKVKSLFSDADKLVNSPLT